MSLVSKVEVLCTNGHRVTVNVKPNTKLFQIAEECCLKQRLGEASAFGLKLRHNQKPVDLSLSVQLSGLANNAKLDLYERTKQKLGAKAKVALQLDDAGRIQREFDPATTVWEMLESFQRDSGSDIFHQLTDGNQPIINYMKDEVIGEYALKNTTLRMLGILDGGHLLRLSFKPVSPEALEEIRGKIDAEKARLTRLAAKAASVDKEPPTVTSHNQSGVSTISDPVPSLSQTAQFGSPFVGVFPVDSLDPSSSVLSQTCRGIAENMDIQDFQMDVQSEYSASNSGTTHHHQQFPFMEFKFPEESKGKNFYHNELSEVKRENFQPCDRELVLYNLNDVEGIEYEPEQDDFFEHTVGDISSLQSTLSQEVAAFNDQPLLTEAMRKERRSARFANYSRFILRFQYPDGLILQAVFRPLETVFSVYKFVKEKLEDKKLEFELFMSPPKVVLTDKTQNLIEAGLSPMSVVYVKAGDKTDGFLSREVLNNLTFPSEAKKVCEKYMPASSFRSKVSKKGSADNQPSTSAQASSGRSGGSNYNRPQNSASSTSSDKIPKWFKPGK